MVPRPQELRRQREEKAQLREAERLEKAELRGKSAAKDGLVTTRDDVGGTAWERHGRDMGDL